MRTPLNSILILGQQLAENQGAIYVKQTEFARTFTPPVGFAQSDHGYFGFVEVESARSQLKRKKSVSIRCAIRRAQLPAHRGFKEPTFMGIRFIAAGAMTTDPKRLQQILKNLSRTRSSSPRTDM